MVKERRKTIVVGGGASGMMAAISAARQGSKVVLLERKDSLGKKILVTGNGRCNFTNRKQTPLEGCYRTEQQGFPRAVFFGGYTFLFFGAWDADKGEKWIFLSFFWTGFHAAAAFEKRVRETSGSSRDKGDGTED